MPPLLDRQRQGVRLGSIRIGVRVVKDGKARPEKLNTFRLTSPDRVKIDAAAALYGGVVQAWKPNDGAGQQWEVVTESAALPVRVPPGNPVQQDYELWQATRQRLCDGVTERMKGQPCQCPLDLTERREAAKSGAACKPVTRLSLILADLPGLGVWQLSSTGDSAADELAATAELLQRAEFAGHMLPATLRLEQREARGSGTLHKYAVPVLDVGATMVQLEAGTYPTAAAVTAADRAALTSGAGAGTSGEATPASAPEPANALDVAVLATSATVPDDIRRLKALASKHDWLQDYVPDGGGVHVPLENALYDRYLALGGEG